MKVKDCNNCPFRVDDNHWNIKYCNLHANTTNNIIELQMFMINKEVPYFCPLKEGNLEIQLEEINK